MHCCIKKRNGARKWNIRVVKADRGPLGFHRARWNLNTTLPRIRIDSRFFSPGFRNRPALSLSAISQTVYIHVFITARIEWKRARSLSLSRVSRSPSHLTEWHFSRLVFPPASTHYDLLRSLSCRVASYAAGSRNFARISVGLSRQTTL